VRVGPFASRDEAERAQAKIKAAGASAVVLTL
jgi:cell division protein FtsN